MAIKEAFGFAVGGIKTRPEIGAPWRFGRLLRESNTKRFLGKSITPIVNTAPPLPPTTLTVSP